MADRRTGGCGWLLCAEDSVAKVLGLASPDKVANDEAFGAKPPFLSPGADCPSASIVGIVVGFGEPLRFSLWSFPPFRTLISCGSCRVGQFRGAARATRAARLRPASAIHKRCCSLASADDQNLPASVWGGPFPFRDLLCITRSAPTGLVQAMSPTSGLFRKGFSI